MTAPDAIAELALIEVSRIQRAVLAFNLDQTGKDSDMMKLYARREPDRDYARYGYCQVALYGAPGDPLPVAVYPFHFEGKPRHGAPHAMHNCARWPLEWLPDLIGPPVHVGELRWRVEGYGPGRAGRRASLKIA